ncbi:DUF4116 domain-containing protein, partial [Endozoicomonas sp. ONNA2]|uniref:DUF4116 domain-containing protein n=1 Tax=Endozoicomonas sp. ONNA2 TaxID=2828741 RepID=UPI002148D46B
MNIAGSTTIDKNPKDAREYHPEPNSDSSGQPWGNYFVKKDSGGYDEGGLPVRNMPYTSADAETPLPWSRVQACPAATFDLPQGNLGHELKALLLSVVQCADKQQPLPLSDYKPFIQYFGQFPPNVDLDQLDSQDYLLIVKTNPSYFHRVPEEKLTPELCVVACRDNYANCNYIPEVMKTDALCRALALENIDTLEFIPDKIKRQWLNNGFLDRLLKTSGEVMLDIPLDERTDCRFEIACKIDPSALKHYPKNKPINDHLLTIAIEHFGSLQYCPDHKKTAELCEVACRRNGLALEYVPEQLKTAPLCQLAVENNAMAFEFIPEAVKTYEICLAAARGGQCSGKLPEFLTEAQQTEIYRTACICGMFTLKYVPERLITFEFLASVITSNKHRFSPLAFTSGKNLNNYVAYDKAIELYSLALCLSPDALPDVPNDAKIRAIFDAALNKDLSILRYIPPKKLSATERCLQASAPKRTIEPEDLGEELMLFELIRNNKTPYVPTNIQLMYLTSSSVSMEEKLSFIESLDAPTYTFPKQVINAPLICQKSPLQWISSTNLFLIPLISTAHQVTGFALP